MFFRIVTKSKLEISQRQTDSRQTLLFHIILRMIWTWHINCELNSKVDWDEYDQAVRYVIPIFVEAIAVIDYRI